MESKLVSPKKNENINTLGLLWLMPCVSDNTINIILHFFISTLIPSIEVVQPPQLPVPYQSKQSSTWKPLILIQVDQIENYLLHLASHLCCQIVYRDSDQH